MSSTLPHNVNARRHLEGVDALQSELGRLVALAAERQAVHQQLNATGSSPSSPEKTATRAGGTGLADASSTTASPGASPAPATRAAETGPAAPDIEDSDAATKSAGASIKLDDSALRRHDSRTGKGGAAKAAGIAEEDAQLIARLDALAERTEAALGDTPDSPDLQHILRETQALSGRVYLRARGVPRTLDNLVQQLLTNRPADPIGEMLRLVEARMSARRP